MLLPTPSRFFRRRRRVSAAAVLAAALSAAAVVPAACRAQEPSGAAAAAPAGRPPSPIAGGRAEETLVYSGAADLRYRSADQETRGSYLAATRLQADWERAGLTGGFRGGARVQLLLETDGLGTRADRLRASEVYGFYDFALQGVSARVKVGQFVLPFGLLAVYDWPLQPLQPLYEKALGLRVDTGIQLVGEYGPFRYAGSITTGVGPNRSDFDANKVVTFRLARTVFTPFGPFEVGGSLMTGRGPVTTIDTELPASGTSGARRFVDKTRFAADGVYVFKPLTLRGEFVFGGDDEDAVWGYFAEADYEVTSRLSLIAFRRLCNFAQKPMSASSTGLGADYHFGNGLRVRALFEYQRDVPLPAGTSPLVVKRFTLQTRINF